MRKVLYIIGSIAYASLIGCGEQKVEHDYSNADIQFLSNLSLTNLSAPLESESNQYSDSLAAAKMGHRLFFDSDLSSNGSVSCATCHQPAKYFTDGLKRSVAIGMVKRNAPSVLPSAWSHWQFWDGRKDSLWSQALGPFEDPSEHNFSRTKVANHIIKNYREPYEETFTVIPESIYSIVQEIDATPLGTTRQKSLWRKLLPEQQKAINQVFANVGKALMAYQRQLKMQPAKFDGFVDALSTNSLTSSNVLSNSEQNGMRLFLGRANCVSCHNGPLFSNFEFHNIGAPESDKQQVDLGRFSAISALVNDEFTCLSEYSDAEPENCMEMRFLKKKGPELVGAFKTPSLRNIGKTAPYMQTGQFDTLEQVISHYDMPTPPYYNRLQHPSRPHFDILPLKLSEQEKADLISFLQTLTSPIDSDDLWWQAPLE
jgi:cytochrome c peroxidase